MADFEREGGPEHDDIGEADAGFTTPDQAAMDRILNYGGTESMSLGETANYLSTTEADVLARTIWREQMEALWNAPERPDTDGETS